MTNNDGQYRIVDLRPGTYVVTFQLPGFTTMKREDIILTAGFTATVNADMSVGALAETVTVTGATPLVDTQNVRQQIAVTDQVLDSLPTGTTAVSNLAAFTPGLTTTAGSNVGGSAGTYNSSSVITSTFHGKSGAITQFDGMNINNPVRPGATGFIVSPATLQEWVVETGGGLAESNAGTSIAMNVIPKEGGNSFRGSGQALFSNSALQGDNLTDALRARGLTTVSQINYLYDTNFDLGGPIKRDKIWFFTAHRAQGNEIQRPGIFFNATQGTPFYTPDPSRPANREDFLESHAGRVTWQINAKNKLNAYAEPQRNCVCRARGEFVAPEAAYRWDFWPTGLYQATWNATITSRLLFEAAVGASMFDWPNYLQPETGNAISILDQATGFIYGSTQGFPTTAPGPRRAPPVYAARLDDVRHWFALLQDRLPPHGGFHRARSLREPRPVLHVSWEHADDRHSQWGHGVREPVLPEGGDACEPWCIRAGQLEAEPPHAQSGAAIRIRERRDTGAQRAGRPVRRAAQLRRDQGRPELDRSEPPDRRVVRSLRQRTNGGQGILRPIRGGYVHADRAGNQSDFRERHHQPHMERHHVWRRRSAHGQLHSRLRPEGSGGERRVRRVRQPEFRHPEHPGALLPDVVTGFGNRQYLWDLATEVQQQVAARTSVTVGYYRNWDGNLTATDNLEVVPADYSTYCITAPSNPRLPGGGGYQVCGLADVSRERFGRTNTLVSRSSNFGGYTRVSDFFAVNLTSRFAKGVQLGGGLDTGRSVSDKCSVVDSPAQALYDFIRLRRRRRTAVSRRRSRRKRKSRCMEAIRSCMASC